MRTTKPDILLCMARHADTEKEKSKKTDDERICGQSNGMPLIPEGGARSWMLGLTFAKTGLKPDRLEVSPALRSKETGRIAFMAAGWQLKPIEVPEIHEISQGRWEGKLKRVHSKAQSAGIAAQPMDFRAPGGGESLRDLMIRNRQHLHDLEDIQLALGCPLVVVAIGHSLSIAAGVGDVLGWEPEQISRQEIPCCSTTTFVYRQQDWTVEQIARSAEDLKVYA